MKAKKTEIHVHHSHETRPVGIVADAAVSTRGRHGGRLLPLLLLDTTDRPDIAEFIRVHESLGPGDVKVQWGKVEAKGQEGTVALFLTFIRPLEFFMVLEFNIARQGFLVEQTLLGHGIYLARAEGEDDRLIKNPGRPKVIVEVPDAGFRDTWDDIFHKRSHSIIAARDMRSRSRNLTTTYWRSPSRYGFLKLDGRARFNHVPIVRP
jgi:hypothetical protein